MAMYPCAGCGNPAYYPCQPVCPPVIITGNSNGSNQVTPASAVTPLEQTADLTDVITTVNQMITALQNAGMMQTQ